MSFGRDVRDRLFHQVLDFSAREVGRFGAPSLITRITNDVQQVQILVAMGCTMMIAAPITAVIGVIMAVREDLGLSIVLVINIPLAVIVLGFLVSRMVPAFQLMQERVDQVNRVMREQITGIRVVRAFVREPEEGKRFEKANDDLTDVSLRTGRLMAAMFPTVMLIINMSSIGVLWVGADRISAGSMQIGALIAYLSYLIQIMMSVVMATFMMSMIPRARVAAERIQEVLVTPSSLTVPADPVRALVTPGTLEFRNVGFHYPGADDPVLHEISFATRPGETTAIIGSTGSGKTTLVNLVPRLFDATSGCGPGRRRRRAGARPRAVVGPHRVLPAEAVPVLGHRGLEPPLRAPRRERGRDVGGARRGPGERLRASHAPRARQRDRSGRQQRVGRPAPATRHRPRPGRRSPRSTCSTTRSRRST